MKLWLDDTKVAPEGWTWVKTQTELEALLVRENGITHISLDGELAPGCGSGLNCSIAIAKLALRWEKDLRLYGKEMGGLPPICVTCHSFSRYLREDITKNILVALNAWAEGLTYLGVIAAANKKDGSSNG